MPDMRWFITELGGMMPRLGKYWIGLIIVGLSCTPLSINAGEFPKFAGDLRPLVTPILLRIAPTTFRRQVVEAFVTVVGSKSQSHSIIQIMEGPIIAMGEQLEWQQSIWIGTDESNIRISRQPMSAKIRTDRRGNWTSIELSGTNPDDGSAIRKGTAAYDELVADVGGMLYPQPENPVSQGDDLIREALEIAKQSLFSELPREVDLDFDMQEIVTGQTALSGRRGIVADISGDASFDVEGKPQRLTFGGYVVIDAGSGTILDGRIVCSGNLADNKIHVDIKVSGSVN